MSNRKQKIEREGYRKMNPLVSVIMPSYNGEKFIGRAIESILDQTYSNWELIIIDDASTDHSLKVIETYKDKRIKLLCNEVNRGISETTNRGIRESEGTYIALLDDDDIAEKDRFTLQVDYLEHHKEIDILGGRTTFIDESERIIDYSYIPRNNPKYIKAVLLFSSTGFSNGTAMIRKKFIEKFNLYYENGCYGMQDYKFYLDSSKVGNISSIPQFVLKYRVHSGNETNKNFQFFQNERKKTYARFQRDSLEKSGFCLTADDLALINKALAERDGKCDSLQELKQLYQIFYKLLQQGRKMGIDYLDELGHVCRVRMADQIIQMKNFFEEDIEQQKEHKLI